MSGSRFQSMCEGVIKTAQKTFSKEELVTYNYVEGGSEEITGIFENGYTEIDPETQTPIVSNAPVLDIDLSDLTRNPTKGDTVEMDGKTYDVTASREDGRGASKLILVDFYFLFQHSKFRSYSSMSIHQNQ